MASLFAGIGALLGTGAAAAGTGAAAAGTALMAVPGIAGAMTWTPLAAAAGAGAAGAGLLGGAGMIASILSGTATVLSTVAAFRAGDMEADRLMLEADDAEREIPLENLQGIERRSSIKAALRDQLGDQDVANAASGIDLSFGTARQARGEAMAEADRALTSDGGTQMTRVARLAERAANYRRMAKYARRSGRLEGYGTALRGGVALAGRY